MKSMIYEDEHYYVCHDGRELHHIRAERRQQEGYVQTFEVYGYALSRRRAILGDIKENEDFRRFHYRSTEKVYREFLLYVIGRNLNKYHRFSTGKLKKYEPKSDENAA